MTGTKIAILSCENSVGRTTIARMLSLSAKLRGDFPVQLVCLDVEKPDLIDIVGTQSLHSQEIYAPQPVIDISKCRYCGVCSGYCPEKAIQFNRFIPSVTLIVSRCFACGKCMKWCSRKGIRMQQKLTGTIMQAGLDKDFFIAGRLSENSEFRIPLIKSVLSKLVPDVTAICDFAPGTDTTVTAVLPDMDFAVVVIEPDIYREDNLDLMINILNRNNVAAGILLNKFKGESVFRNNIKSYCYRQSIPFLGTIHYDKRLEFFSNQNHEKQKSIAVNLFSAIWKQLDGLQPASDHFTEIKSNNYSNT